MTQAQKEKQFLEEQDRLKGFIRKRVPYEEDAEDIMQDVFYQFLFGTNTLGSIEKVSSWLFRVAKNKIADLYRKKKPVNFSKMQRNDEDENLSLFDNIPDFNNTPEDEIMKSVLQETLEEGLAELPEEQRAVFVAHELDRKSFEEMEREWKVPKNTLLSRKRYAVLYLRKKLYHLYEEL